MRSEESRKKTSDAIKAWHASMTPQQKDERRKKQREVILNLSEEEKKKRSEKISKGNKAAYIKDPTLKERTSKSLKEAAKRPEVKLKRSKAIQKYLENRTEEEKQERSKQTKERLSDPEVRQKMSDSRKKYYRENPLARIKSKAHKQKISDSISKGILEGKGNGYFKSSKRGNHISSKAGKVYYRSAYELKAFEMLDLDETVKIYTHDSYRIPYETSNGIRHYILDLTVFYVDNTVKYVEVKPKDFLNVEEVKAKILIAQKHLGSLFEVWTEKELGIDDPTKLYR